MAHSLTTIGLHLECAIQAEMVVELELALIERKQSCRFWHKSIIILCKKATKRVRKCAKVKGRVKETPLVAISPNYTTPKYPTVSVLTYTYTQLKKWLQNHRNVA